MLKYSKRKTDPAAATGSWWVSQRSRLRRDLITIATQAYLLSLLVRHPRLPWPAKIVGGCAIGYIFSPVQLIPTFIPLVGQVDDLLVLFLAGKVARKFAPPAVLAERGHRAELVVSAHAKRCRRSSVISARLTRWLRQLRAISATS
jgi:uncharacterized membrane protein YkvA (DUF1232 family)